MSNSPLVNYTKISPNKNTPRKHAIDRITPHCYVGQVTVESAGAWFEKSSTQASCNYVIDKDGRVGLIVDEKDRSWCSSSADNDHRAVTIECASDKVHPYRINDTVYNKLIELCVDICKRNGKKKLLWFSDKSKSLSYSPKSDEMVITVHRWFANKSCPGDYIYERLGQIAAEVTKRLGGTTTTTPSTPKPVSAYKVKIDIDNLRIRKGPGTNYEANGFTGKGVFTIVEEKSGPGSVKGWGKLKSGAGWVSLDYAKKV